MASVVSGPFAPSAMMRVYLVAILFGHYAVNRRRYQYIHGQRQQILIRDRFTFGISLQRAVFNDVLRNIVDIETVSIMNGMGNITYGDHFYAELLNFVSGNRADFSESLDRARRRVVQSRCTLAVVRQMPNRMLDRVDNAATGAFRTTKRTADFNRFSGHNTRYRKTALLRVSIHDPSHVLGVSADIWSRNISIRSDDHIDFRRIATSQRLRFRSRKLARVDSNSAFGSAQRQATSEHLNVMSIASPAVSDKNTLG